MECFSLHTVRSVQKIYRHIKKVAFMDEFQREIELIENNNEEREKKTPDLGLTSV